MKPAREPHLLSGAYVLGAVTPEEATAVEHAMETSEELRGEVAELSDTAVLLGMSVRAEQPPAELKNRLMDLIAETPQLPPLPEPVEQDEVEQPSAQVRMPDGGHAVRPRRRPRARRATVLVAIAAVAVLLFGGGLLVDRTMQDTGSHSSATRFAQLTSASDVQRTAAAVAGGGTATVYWSQKLAESAVVLNGVDKPSGKSLQIWRVTGASAVSAGLYSPRAGERYTIMKGAFSPDEKMAVTVEPVGGSKQPTTKPIVVVGTA